MLVGSIEAGGTKFVCAVGNEHGTVQDQIVIPTTTPQETLEQTVAYFQRFKLQALGIASFGPLEIDPQQKNYGYITNTPKLAWQNTDFVGPLKQALAVPIAWTTDVNGSAYGEYQQALATGEQLSSLVYYTIGTGVGGGAVINGQLLGSAGHPEMGHVLVKRHPNDLDFSGICPYHHDCLEGLASGPTFLARTGKPGTEVALNDPVWEIMSYYVAQALLQTTLILRPNRIILGGGVMGLEFLQKIRQQFKKLLNGYLTLPALDDYLQLPQVAGNGSATLGNLIMAAQQIPMTIS
ncbi:ROK family protein [Lactobacillus sp. DCY120]|uniref:Fructokinase n=1 Tax=Bombilactobacillus apium TaxID=2675299 RepID=A0A850R873_9LACO|nr:ROK family protein [Bombilactobacillus apium]NVY95596.1 ROK family protein [Bombilactobacillus apium]